ncbi:MAG: hypothetical protein Q9224_007098 [Gallowayella concinna]
MLEFLYTHSYNLNETLPRIENQKDRKIKFLETHIALYVLGDKYALPSLCQYSVDCFRILLDRHGWKRDTDVLLACIPSVYAGTPENDRTLRDIIIQAVTHRMFGPEIRCSEDKKGFLDSMQHNEQFRNDMMGSILDTCEMKNLTADLDSDSLNVDSRSSPSIPEVKALHR